VRFSNERETETASIRTDATVSLDAEARKGYLRLLLGVLEDSPFVVTPSRCPVPPPIDDPPPAI
jgi:hypothetical protein